MRSLTRISVLMGPPWVVFGRGRRSARPDAAALTPPTSKKALHEAGPIPTDHGLKSIKPPAHRTEQTVYTACDRTTEPQGLLLG